MRGDRAVIGGELLHPKQRRQIGRISALRRCTDAWLARCWACTFVALARSALPAANRFRPTASQRSSGPLPPAQYCTASSSGSRAGVGDLRCTPPKLGLGTENDWRAEPHAALASMLRPCTGSFFNINQILLADSWRIGLGLSSKAPAVLQSCVASRCHLVTRSYRTKVAKQRQEP